MTNTLTLLSVIQSVPEFTPRLLEKNVNAFAEWSLEYVSRRSH